MEIIENLKGIENVITQEHSNGNIEYFIYDDLNCQDAKHLIVNHNDKKLKLRFDIYSNFELVRKIQDLYPGYMIQEEGNHKCIVIKKGLLNIIAYKEGMIYDGEINELVPLYVSREKEYSYEIKSNEFFRFRTEDDSDKIFISKKEKSLMNYNKALDIKKMILEKREIENLKYKLRKQGFETKNLKKKTLEELKKMAQNL